jgi:hypothetical protein
MQLVFFHIPKTGGTSLKYQIRQFCDKQKKGILILDSYDLRDSQKTNYKVTFNGPNPVSFIQIHEWNPYRFFNFDLLPNHNNKRFTFTILRHPISLFYSIYYHIKRNLNDFLVDHDHPQRNSLYINLLIKSRDINQFIDLILDLDFLFKGTFTDAVEQSRTGSARRQGTFTDAVDRRQGTCILLPKGYYNQKFLESLDFVGIFEDMELTLTKLNQLTNNSFELDSRYVKNVGNYDKNYSYRYGELIKLFSEDLQIYNIFLNNNNNNNG